MELRILIDIPQKYLSQISYIYKAQVKFQSYPEVNIPKYLKRDLKMLRNTYFLSFYPLKSCFRILISYSEF